MGRSFECFIARDLDAVESPAETRSAVGRIGAAEPALALRFPLEFGMLANNSRTLPRLARLERITAYAGASCSSAAACILFADLVSPKMVLQGDGLTMARAHPVSVDLALLLLSVGATLLGWVLVSRVDPHGDG